MQILCVRFCGEQVRSLSYLCVSFWHLGSYYLIWSSSRFLLLGAPLKEKAAWCAFIKSRWENNFKMFTFPSDRGCEESKLCASWQNPDKTAEESQQPQERVRRIFYAFRRSQWISGRSSEVRGHHGAFSLLLESQSCSVCMPRLHSLVFSLLLARVSHIWIVFR